MTKLEEYRKTLSELDDWTSFLLKNSGLPGPRGNLELAEAAADMAGKQQVESWLRIPPEQSPENSAMVFLVFFGVTALGKMAARGERQHLMRLRSFASDPRWRVREAVAIALQYVGDSDMRSLLSEMKAWSAGNWYEKRAAAAALAEPRLLKDPTSARAALKLFDHITKDIASSTELHDGSFKVLRQSMGYCWSVVVAALPEDGKLVMEKWMASSNPDVRWIMKENLKKSRLERMDAEWVGAGRVRSQRIKPMAAGTDIRSTIIGMEQAALERWGKGDPGGFLEIYALDVAYFDPYRARRVDGLDALTALYKSFWGQVHIDRFELVNPLVQVSGDVAVLTFNYVSYTGDEQSAWNCTEVYRRDGGNWRIIQTHWSYTLHGVTDKA